MTTTTKSKRTSTSFRLHMGTSMKPFFPSIPSLPSNRTQIPLSKWWWTIEITSLHPITRSYLGYCCTVVLTLTVIPSTDRRCVSVMSNHPPWSVPRRPIHGGIWNRQLDTPNIPILATLMCFCTNQWWNPNDWHKCNILTCPTVTLFDPTRHVWRDSCWWTPMIIIPTRCWRSNKIWKMWLAMMKWYCISL